jgi:hypothetical protein
MDELMIFLYFLQLTIGIVVFIPATVLLIGALRFPGKGSTFGITIGVIVMLLSTLSIVCSSYYALKYWHKDIFEKPMMMQNS